MNSERPKLQLTREQSNLPKIFITAYGPKRRISLSFPATEGRTKQSFKDECDINTIMRRYAQTGVLEHTRREQPRYDDVTGYDYQRAMDIVADARTAFAELPAAIRDRFNNDPGELLDFVQDEENLDEAAELGLVSAEALQRRQARAKDLGDGAEPHSGAQRGGSPGEPAGKKSPLPAKPKSAGKPVPAPDPGDQAE